MENHRIATLTSSVISLAILAAVLASVPAPAHAGSDVLPVSAVEGIPSRIAFGSCCKQDKPHPALTSVVATNPDLFVYLGDNIYGDTEDMAVLREKYGMLGAKPEFQRLRREVATVAIWDDHDYGANDAGKEYPKKEESREVFLDFWEVPTDSPRRKRPGIYGAHRFTAGGRTLQLILLDTRTFRDRLKRNPDPKKPEPPFKNDYRPDPDAGKTLLGEAQWTWLEERFREPADVRIVATSIQFGHEYNGWESWTNLPAEQKKMAELIKETRAGGVVFISGDVHWGEISKFPVDGGYPFYDVTSSGLTETWPTLESNRFRQGAVCRDPNFGVIEIDWDEGDPALSLRLFDGGGELRNEQRVRLSALQVP